MPPKYQNILKSSISMLVEALLKSFKIIGSLDFPASPQINNSTEILTRQEVISIDRNRLDTHQVPLSHNTSKVRLVDLRLQQIQTQPAKTNKQMEKMAHTELDSRESKLKVPQLVNYSPF